MSLTSGWAKRYAEKQEKAKAEAPDRLREFMCAYKCEHPEAHWIHAAYSGSGDEGFMDETTVLNKPCEYDELFADGPQEWEGIGNSDIEDECYELIAAFYSGFENGDGGGGQITLDLTTLEIHLSHYWNEMTTVDESDLHL